jgi:hypothetical protein
MSALKDSVQVPPLDWKSNPNSLDVYSNLIMVNWSLFDVRILFGQVVPPLSESVSRVVAEQRAAVTVAWAEAKVLRDLLTDAIQRYETVNGVIKPPVPVP